MQLSKIRYLRHPYLIRRNLFRSSETEKIDRVKEYDKFTVTATEFHSSMNFTQHQIPESLQSHLQLCMNEISGRFDAMSPDFQEAIYSIVRNVEPEIVV